VRIQLVYFASVREAIGQPREQWETECSNLDALRSELQQRGEPWYTALGHDKPLRCAVNHTMVQGNVTLQNGDEVAFFPPVTGG
jgi:molybdopterin synthase sulfur carrier subunit